MEERQEQDCELDQWETLIRELREFKRYLALTKHIDQRLNTIFIVQSMFGIHLNISLDNHFKQHLLRVLKTELNQIFDIKGKKSLVIKELLMRLREQVVQFRKMEGSESQQQEESVQILSQQEQSQNIEEQSGSKAQLESNLAKRLSPQATDTLMPSKNIN